MWIERAAKAGLPEARLRLAQLELAGGDRLAATANLEAAAEAGFVEAQFDRAKLATEDDDAPTARRWYAAAAHQGHGPSQFNLALLLLDEGRADAPTEALAWLILAAEAETANATAARDQVASALDADSRTKAAALAERLRQN